MRPFLLASLLLAACAASPGDASSPERSGPVGAPRDRASLTRWGRDLDREAPLPAYPRPTLVRQRWHSLNGPWQFEVAREGQPPPFGRDLESTILVPFAPEAPLSGVGKHHPRFWYRRTFRVPTGWRRDRILLQFGADDWEAEVWVNGRRLALHRGGYDPFSVDITAALLPVPDQELIVRVFDPTDRGEQMRGKQVLDPGGIWYSPVSGIWQTVWIEPVPRRGIDALYIEPDLDRGEVGVRVEGIDPLGGDRVEVEVRERGGLITARRGGVGELLVAPIPSPRAWSPEDPFLYDLRVTRTGADGRVLERVESYFALRKVERSVGEDGKARILLNGKPRFLRGVLDQGWWPDGLYTAPSDEALRFDVATAKAMGFDLIRKHVKVEPERWYAWCDRLGVLVWQDIPNGAARSGEGRRQFEEELDAIVAARRFHPSIIGWVLFNEGWGQYDTPRLCEHLAGLDPTRLVTCASGWTDAPVGDVIDVHHYPGPVAPRDPGERIPVLGEFGGISWPVPGHSPVGAWGYQGVRDAQELSFAYEDLQRELVPLKEAGLGAAIYTQLSDVESEANGLVTYDREVIKVAPAEIARMNREQFTPLHVLLPTSKEAPHAWRYRFDSPGEGWSGDYGRSLDLPGPELGWQEGQAGFGSDGTPGAIVRTTWTSPDIWLVTDFQLGALPEGEIVLNLHHDEEATVWVNGREVLSRGGFTTDYVRIRTGLSARDLLVKGTNRVAVHCHQTSGGQYIDLGIEVMGTR